MLEEKLRKVVNQVYSSVNTLPRFSKTIYDKDNSIGNEIHELILSETNRIDLKDLYNTLLSLRDLKKSLSLFEIKELIVSTQQNIKVKLQPYINYPKRKMQKKVELKEFVSAQLYIFITTIMDEISRFMDNKKAVVYSKIQNNLRKGEMAKDIFVKPLGKLLSKTGFITEPKTFIEKLI